MTKDTSGFDREIKEGYRFEGPHIALGGAMLDGHGIKGLHVGLPLKTLNRHGLVAGATGTGKTKTVQLMVEQLSAAGIPSLVMDIKGDLSGLAVPGSSHPKIGERMQQIGLPWEAGGYPVELLTISDEKGVTLRATVSEFGPVLFSRILDLNETQTGVVSMVFKYCDDHNLLLLDLKDFRMALQYLTNEGRKEVEREYGRISTASTGAVIRKIIRIEEQGAERFFGEQSFDPDELLRLDDQGRGLVSIVRLSDIQDRPQLFSTFMLSLLSEIYATFPEEGDAEQPKLMFFIDEAHLVFKEATSELLDQIETIVKLIRSKGVGLVFCTQTPGDIPDAVLSQLGLKIQHSLRAFTARDRKAIRKVAENYPDSPYYDTAELLTGLGIGEALLTALDEKGKPTPLVHTLLRAPTSRMDVLTPEETDRLVRESSLASKYNKAIDRESAYELLEKKMEQLEEEAPEDKPRGKKQRSVIGGTLGSTAGRQVLRTVARELTRGLLGALGISGTTRRRRRR